MISAFSPFAGRSLCLLADRNATSVSTAIASRTSAMATPGGEQRIMLGALLERVAEPILQDKHSALAEAADYRSPRLVSKILSACRIASHTRNTIHLRWRTDPRLLRGVDCDGGGWYKKVICIGRLVLPEGL
jgi:hypothetical protein